MEILDKTYLSAMDLKKLIPDASINTCREMIKEAQRIMVEKGYLIPQTKTKLALTKIIRKQYGI